MVSKVLYKATLIRNVWPGRGLFSNWTWTKEPNNQRQWRKVGLCLRHCRRFSAFGPDWWGRRNRSIYPEFFLFSLNKHSSVYVGNCNFKAPFPQSAFCSLSKHLHLKQHLQNQAFQPCIHGGIHDIVECDVVISDGGQEPFLKQISKEECRELLVISWQNPPKQQTSSWKKDKISLLYFLLWHLNKDGKREN